MKKMLQIGGAVLGLLAIAGLGVTAQEVNERIPPKEITEKAVDFFGEYDADEVIKAATKEYVIDSIEEVNTERRWKEQQQVNAMILEYLMRLDTNVRLDVRQGYEINKKLDQ